MTGKYIVNEYGTIQSIAEVHGYEVRPVGPMQGSRLAGFSQILSSLSGHSSMEGYKIVTDHHELLILIDDQSSCCESWGYIQSEDDLSDYIGAQLSGIQLTDTALSSEAVTKAVGEYGVDSGGIQFVDLVTNRGKFQLAVYNSHNGYYGHGIVVAVDNSPILEDIL